MLKNIIIAVMVSVAAVASGVIVQNDNSVVNHDVIVSDVCVVSSVVPAVPAMPEETTTNTSISSVVSSAVCEPSAVPAVTTITTLDTVPDIIVSDTVITAENSVVSSVAVSETVSDDIHPDTIVSDNTDTNVSDIQDDANNADMYNVNDLYSLCTVVSDIDINNDIVYCEDFNGNIWSFYGVDDWFVNDTCVMLMYDNNTEIIYDDIILSCTYTAYTVNNNADTIVSDNIDSSENADIMPDDTDNNDIVDTSKDTLFAEYIALIESGDYIE